MDDSGRSMRRLLLTIACCTAWPFAAEVAAGDGWPEWSLHHWVVWLTGAVLIAGCGAVAEIRSWRMRPFEIDRSRPVVPVSPEPPHPAPSRPSTAGPGAA